MVYRLYRLLRKDEDWSFGLSAKNPIAEKSVFDHVIDGSRTGWQSQYIATCGSTETVKMFESNSHSPGHIVRILVDDSQVTIIDLRTSVQRSSHYQPDNLANDLIEKFNNYANKYETVLLVGNIPIVYVRLSVSASLTAYAIPP